MEVDLAAEKILAAEKDNQKIAVEIKSFINPSTINDFHTALGQFLNYRLALELTDPERLLFLAVPVDIFSSFFQEEFPRAAIKKYDLKLIAYEPNLEEIISWKK